MAARRLMIVLMALIAVSMAITVIAQPLRNRFGPPGATSTTTSATTSEAAAAKAKAPPSDDNGNEVIATLSPSSARKVQVEVGDQLTLFVKVVEPAEVSIPGLGLLAYADAYAPARFDLLPTQPGSFVVESASGQKLGVIYVSGGSRAGGR
jgi:hypothetical protein